MADLHTQDVTFVADGGSCAGYLARPADGQPRPALIVVQEWWGLVDHIKDIARRFAAEGYVVLAPDLYHGATTTDAGEAMKLLQGLDQAAAVRDVLGGIEHLKSLNVGKIGIVGYCMGGAITLRTAIASRDISAAAPYYGPNPDPLSLVEGITAPVLAFYGEADPMVTPAAAQALENEMKRLGKSIETHVYPNADHGFFNDDRPEVYDPSASQDAWDRTLGFFSKHLRT